MKPISDQKSNEGQKAEVFDTIAAIYAWLEIVAATLIVGLIIGSAVYFSMRDKTGLALSIAIIVIALFVGIILATKAWKNKGPIH